MNSRTIVDMLYGAGISTKCLAVSVTQFSIHNVCTYIHTIHNALAEAVCCCFPKNTVFTTFSL